MAVAVYYCDMRAKPSILAKAIVEWHSVLTAFEAATSAVGAEYAAIIADDLNSHDNVIMVSWYNKATDENSDLSDYGSLDWTVPDHSQIIISYDDTATPEQIDEFERWMVDSEQNDGL